MLPDETASWATLNRFNLLTETIDSDTQVALEWLGSANFGGYDGVNMRWSGFADRDNEGDNTFYRGEITLYHDDPVRPMRYELGDLTTFTSGHVSGLNMGGIGISRAYRELQPRREISPGNTQQFYLPSSADVEIQVNGFTVLRRQFNPGRYELNDLPLTSEQMKYWLLRRLKTALRKRFSLIISTVERYCVRACRILHYGWGTLQSLRVLIRL